MQKARKCSKKAASTCSAREGEHVTRAIKFHMEKLVKLISGSDDVQSSLSNINVKVAKTTAKKDWFLADHEIT
jgi:hypothetical protein